jgi:hypothetical protein
MGWRCWSDRETRLPLPRRCSILRVVRRGQGQIALVVVLCAALLAPVAAGSPRSDAAAVVKDYTGDANIASCRFTRDQLENALAQIGPDAATYSAGFSGEVTREIKRWADGACAGKRRGAALRIVKVSAKGGARTESVTIKNTGKKAVDLRRYVLRDSSDHTIRFKKTKLKGRRTLRVVTGCRKGQRAAVRRGSRYYACRKSEFWDDGGDVVELVTPQGGLLSRKGY